MALRFFNTYSRELEEFRPLDPDGREVKMYTCGPTVYSHAHIGNFRAYLFEDLLQRHLELRGYSGRSGDESDRRRRQNDPRKPVRRIVPLARIHRSHLRRRSLPIWTRLRIKRGGHFSGGDRSSAIIEAMIAMIATLIARDLAYQADDKSVYFRINRFPNYGHLAHFDLDELRSTGRVKNDEYDKEHIGDFALWKAWDEADGDVRVGESVGPRPAGLAHRVQRDGHGIARRADRYSLRRGGQYFPASRGGDRADRRLHRPDSFRALLAALRASARRRAENVEVVREFLHAARSPRKGYSGREVRYALLRVHYRAQLNFTWEGMEEARQALGRIDDWLRRFAGRSVRGKCCRSETPSAVEDDKFAEALDDDLNISAALGFLFEQIRETNRELDGGIDPARARVWLKWWERIDSVLALEAAETKPSDEIVRLTEERAQARLAKDWQKSDELRDALQLAVGMCATRRMDKWSPDAPAPNEHNV